LTTCAAIDDAINFDISAPDLIDLHSSAFVATTVAFAVGSKQRGTGAQDLGVSAAPRTKKTPALGGGRAGAKSAPMCLMV
jgi:hypothetical protein